MNTALLFASLSALIPWQSIELNQKLSLNASVQLNEQVHLKQGSLFKVVDLLPLDQINVMSYKLKLTPCTSALKTQTSDMVIINELYGFQLAKNCELSVFLEFHDLQNPSLFYSIQK